MRYASFIAVLLSSKSVIAAPCEYQKDVNSLHLKKIERSEVERKAITMTSDNQARCTVKIKSLVDKRWYQQIESFIFDPFVMTAKEGCDRAVVRAKEKIYDRASREGFRSTTTMKCSSRQKVEKKDVFLNVLPSSLMGYGEHREVVLNPKCTVSAGKVTYKEGYTLHGYKEICK